MHMACYIIIGCVAFDDNDDNASFSYFFITATTSPPKYQDEKEAASASFLFGLSSPIQSPMEELAIKCFAMEGSYILISKQ